MRTKGSARSALTRIDALLLTAGALTALAATARYFGTDGIRPATVVLLAVSAVCCVPPLIRYLSRADWGRGTVLLILFMAHLAATLFFFPPEDFLNDRPILTLDHSIHYYQAERARRIFPSTLSLQTYDPYFMAGYPAGTIFDVDSKGLEIFCSLFRFADTARECKLFVMLGHLLLVLTVYAGCRRLGFAPQEAVFSVLFFLAFWHWGRPYAGDFRYAGMFSYLIVCHLSLYVAGLFRSFLGSVDRWKFLLIGTLIFLIHPAAAVILAVPLVTVLVTASAAITDGKARSLWNRRVLLYILVWGALVLAVNSVWIVPLIRYLDAKEVSKFYFQINGLPGLFRLMAKPGNAPAILLAALSIAGVPVLKRQGRSRDTAVPALSALFLILLAAFGVYIPGIDQMEPGRFLLPAFVFMSPLAGAAAASLTRSLRSFLERRGSAIRPAALAAVMLIISIPVLSLFESREFYRHTLTTTFSRPVKDLIDQVTRQTDTSGRLMIEDGPAWEYGECLLPAILPLITGVEQIGGPHPHVFLRQRFAGFTSGEIFGGPVDPSRKDEILGYIRLYRVKWAVTASDRSRALFEAMPDAGMLWSEGALALWAIAPDSTAGGQEAFRAEAGYGEIHVMIDPERRGGAQQSVLLCYHWDRGLKVSPPSRITPELRLSDPVPFIRLQPNGKSDIRIHFE